MNDFEKKQLYAELAEMNSRFDEKLNAIGFFKKDAGYHSKLYRTTVHENRGTLEYALMLLDTYDDSLIDRAEKAIKSVLNNQDCEPSSKSYGLWAWYYEEPVATMEEPDFNWAPFCGKLLLDIERCHGARISASLRYYIKAALLRAVKCIFRRNIHPRYTNIAVMSAYTAIAVGELYWDDFSFNFGMSALKELYDFSMQNGELAEYNSPGYNLIVLTDLARFEEDIKSAEARQMASEIADIAWRTVAEHYLPVVGEWAGPMARAYTRFIPSASADFINYALRKHPELVGENIPFKAEWLHAHPVCPEKYVPYFAKAIPHDIHSTFIAFQTDQPVEYRRGLTKTPNSTVTTHIDTNWSFGTFAVQNTWNQRRNLFAHWGNRSVKAFADVALLHDFYDFSSGKCVTAQKAGRALTAFSVITDGCDTHDNLDPVKHRTITASDLRVRFEFGSTGASELHLSDDKRTASFTCEGISYSVKLIAGDFPAADLCFSLTDSAEELPKLEAMGQYYRRCEDTELRQYLDVVLVKQPEATLKLDAIDALWVLFEVAVGENTAFADKVTYSVSGDRLTAEAQYADGSLLSIGSMSKPVDKCDCEYYVNVDGEAVC